MTYKSGRAEVSNINKGNINSGRGLIYRAFAPLDEEKESNTRRKEVKSCKCRDAVHPVEENTEEEVEWARC